MQCEPAPSRDPTEAAVTGSGPKGLLPAVTRVEWVAFLRLRLYARYDEDHAVQDLLIRFHGDWWNALGTALRRLDDCLPDLPDAEQRLRNQIGSDAATAYGDGLRAIAIELGLDRIRQVGTPPAVIAGYLPSGLAQMHRFLWHLDKALLWEAALEDTPGLTSRPVSRPKFTGLNSFGTPIPVIDSAILKGTHRWDPREETRAVARRRLRRATDLAAEVLEAELDRIAREGEYLFPDLPTQRGGIYRLERDAQWVWWRLRHRWTYERIYREWERLHPGDIRLQLQAHGETDYVAQRYEAENPGVVGELTAPVQATSQIRKAVTTFAARACVDPTTGPGKRRRLRSA